jgi:hypothetical protein
MPFSPVLWAEICTLRLYLTSAITQCTLILEASARWPDAKGFNVPGRKTGNIRTDLSGSAPKGRPSTALGKAQGAGYGSVGIQP